MEYRKEFKIMRGSENYNQSFNRTGLSPCRLFRRSRYACAPHGDEAMTPEQVSLILTALSALGALGAALAAWPSARATSRAAEGQLFSVHYAEYGTPEMLRSLRVLRSWKSKKGDEFELKWKEALDANDQQAHEVDAARRHVKFYFMKVLRLYESGYVSRRFLKELAAVDGINILWKGDNPIISCQEKNKSK